MWHDILPWLAITCLGLNLAACLRSRRQARQTERALEQALEAAQRSLAAAERLKRVLDRTH